MNTGMHRTWSWIAATTILALGLGACSDDDPTQPSGPIDVALTFQANVGQAAFACGQSYPGQGTSNTTVTPVDFRFYVHDVMLVAANGSMVPVELDQTSVWQRESLALLDFENKSGPCVNGTAETNNQIMGTAPAGDYTGVRFILGVPFEMNHQDVATAVAPLDLSTLFWVWNAGYKFARIDHTSDAQPEGWFVHLGSTGCAPNDNPQAAPTACANEHRPVVTLNGFDHETGVVIADYGALLADSDLTQSTVAKGCQSFPNDPECPAVMNNFGLDYEGSVSSGQTFFRTQ